MPMNVRVLDLNTTFPGKPDPATFAGVVAGCDFVSYAGQRVRLRGCAPTWAHLIVAARLIAAGAAVDFLIDDGKEGIVVPITE